MAKNQAATNKVDIFIPIYIGDYLKDTSCLTTEEHGAYLLLIFYYWQHGSIPDDDGKLCRITGLYPDAWSNAKSTLLAYFVQGVNCYRHTRIDNELSKAKSRKEANIARAKTAAGKRWSGKKDASSNAPSNATSTRQAMLEQCPSPSPSHIEKMPPTPKGELTASENDFLKRFNEATGKRFRVLDQKTKRQLKARIKDGYSLDEIIKAAANCSKDDYHKENTRHLTPEFITRADKLQKYMADELGPSAKHERVYTSAEVFHDWDTAGQFSFQSKHGKTHMEYADQLRRDIADMKKTNFYGKYGKMPDEVREIINAYGY